MSQPSSKHIITKEDSNRPEILPFESILGLGLKRFLSELTMVNGAVMVSYICNDQHSNLDDIIVSSAECAVRPGRVQYAHRSHIDFDWGTAPTVVLGMELQDERLTAFFDVVLGDDHVGVDIRGIHFVDPLGEQEDNLRRFAASVFDARLHEEAPSALGIG